MLIQKSVQGSSCWSWRSRGKKTIWNRFNLMPCPDHRTICNSLQIYCHWMCTSRIFEKEEMRKKASEAAKDKRKRRFVFSLGLRSYLHRNSSDDRQFFTNVYEKKEPCTWDPRLTNEIADVATIAEATGRLAEEGFTIGWEIGVSRERQIVVVANIHQRVPEHEVRRYYALRRRRPRQVTIAIALRLLSTLQVSASRPGRIHHHGYKGEGNNNIRSNHNTKSTHSWACPHASEYATDCWSCS